MLKTFYLNYKKFLKNQMKVKKFYSNYQKEKEKNSLDFISYLMMTYLKFWVIQKILKELINISKNVSKVLKNQIQLLLIKH